RSLVFDWPPGDEVEVLGYPRLELLVRSSAPVAFVAAKLCDVFPDGTSALVSRGFLNLTHRHSHQEPEALVPGEPSLVTIELDATSWVFERGHGVRLDIAGSDWPNVWPPPGPVTLSVEPAESRLILPVVGPPEAGEARPAFPSPREEASAGPTGAPTGRTDPVELETRVGVRGSGDVALRPVWRLEHDVLERETRVSIEHGSDSTLEDGSLSVERYEGQVGVSTTNPALAWARGRATFTLAWPEATVTSEARTQLQSDESTWRVSIELSVSEGSAIRWQRKWERRFARLLA